MKSIQTGMRFCLFLILGLAACNSNSIQSGKPGAPTTSDSLIKEISEKTSNADISCLFIGNSHCAGIPEELSQICSKHDSTLNTFFYRCSSYGFLVDHANRKSTLDLIDAGNWDFVVLQAQKYSTSGKFTYPIDGAIRLAERAKTIGAKVILYPEWSRQGFPDEYRRIKALHLDIATKTGATVAPIGEAWKLAQRDSDYNLYAADGNHASSDGKFLNSCVFYWLVFSPETAESLQFAVSKKQALFMVAKRAVQDSTLPTDE